MNDKILMAVIKNSNKKQTAKFSVAISVLRQVPFFTEDEEILKGLSLLVG